MRLTCAEGNMDRSDSASFCSVRRGRRPHGTPRNFMHENRETSVVPDVETGRSGKAIGRRPDMHAAEESDSGVVPMNQPNKSGKPQAEV